MNWLVATCIISILSAFGGKNDKVMVKVNGKAVKALSKTMYDPPKSYDDLPATEMKRTEVASIEVLTPTDLDFDTDSLAVTLKGANGKYILWEEKQTVAKGALVGFHGVTDAANQRHDRNGKKVLLERFVISIEPLHKKPGDYLAMIRLE